MVVSEELLASVGGELQHLRLDRLLHVGVGHHRVGEDDAAGGAVLVLYAVLVCINIDINIRTYNIKHFTKFLLFSATLFPPQINLHVDQSSV